MKHYHTAPRFRVLLQSAALAGALVLQPTQAQPEPATRALRALLAISNAVIPETSTCSADYGQEGQATVKDLLAIQLANLDHGKNTIQGRCTASRCTLTIRHSAGEDMSSAQITFALAGGKARVSTLQCVNTP